jgi:very-short-patch-repair endonuclease
MTLCFNRTSQKQRRRFLRSHLPKAEAVLWMYLSRRQMLGYKFRRQYSVNQYIMDLYYPELKLAIEVDGESHFTETAREYDRRRQEYIASLGISFLRVMSSDVLGNVHGVLNDIAAKIGEIEKT